MRFIPTGALPCLLALQAVAQAPLQFQDIQSRARRAPELGRTETLLAERRLQLQESRGFLREGPTLAFSAGPRRGPGGESHTDQALELDLPLFLSPKVQASLEESLGQAHPLLLDVARRDAALRLRAAYLDAWLAARLLTLREADLRTVEAWLQAARARVESGADPAYQVALVEGERLKVRLERDEARVQTGRCWAVLVGLADLPRTPQPLADPGSPEALPAGDVPPRLQEAPQRKALLAQLEMEERSLRLKESLSLSRWSLRGSHAREGEEQVTRLGLALRLPRLGEGAALRRATESQVKNLQGEGQAALAELDARIQATLARLPEFQSEDAPDFTRAIEAVGLRLQEGREKPSEALPIRRQLLEAQMASLRRLHAQHLLHAEIHSLLPEVAR
jgi:hypothetical protein